MTQEEYAEHLDNFYHFVLVLEELYPIVIDEIDTRVADAMQRIINTADTRYLNKIIYVLDAEPKVEPKAEPKVEPKAESAKTTLLNKLKELLCKILPMKR